MGVYIGYIRRGTDCVVQHRNCIPVHDTVQQEVRPHAATHVVLCPFRVVGTPEK